MTNGSRAAAPAVAAGDCSRPRVKVRDGASYRPRATSRGVPAWPYQRLNCGRRFASSLPGLASAIAWAKSSQVTAWPSWRWK